MNKPAPSGFPAQQVSAQPTRGGVLFDFSLWLSYFF